MANEFDQFDSPANAFDQFDAAHYGSGQQMDAIGGQLVPSGSPQAVAAQSPVSGNNFGQNALIGAGKAYTDIGLGAQQIYADASQPFTGGSMSTILQQQAADKRQLDAPVANTWGGRLGEIGALAPLAFVPGVNSYAGATALGAATGALQPTTANDSRLLNTGVGSALGLGGKFAGDSFSNWLTQRATQPFMGWTPQTADRTLAQAVGSNAPNLNQAALGQRSTELGQVFSAGRNAATGVDLSATPSAVDQVIAGMNPSARALVENNANVLDLVSHATGTGTTNGQALGRISTGLRQDAYTALNSEGGNREVGLALNDVRSHVEDLIQSNIADPQLRAAYTAARPQYGLLQDVRYNPTVLNAATGRSNMDALGKYLQRNNPAYTSAGAADNPLFGAANWGQAGGGAKGAPKFSLATPWSLPLYGVTNNPLSRAVGGAVSNTLSPAAPLIQRGLPGLTSGATPVLLPLWEQ